MGIKLTWNVTMGYKRKILIILLLLMMIATSLFGVYYFFSYRNHVLQRAADNTKTTLTRVDDTLKEIMMEVNNYYVAFCDEKKILYLLHNDLTTKDTSYLQDASAILNGNHIINDSIAEFTLINFDTKKVLSSKGFYHLSEMSNLEEILSLYDLKGSKGRNFWHYTSEGTKSDLMSGYRLTVHTQGSNKILMLPNNSLKINGMLVVRLDENYVYQSVLNRLMEGQNITILDKMGNVVYGSNSQFTRVCAANADNVLNHSRNLRDENQVTYTVEAISFEELGWQIFVGTNYSLFSSAFNIYSILSVVVMLLAFFALVITFCRLIYEPVSELTKLVVPEVGEKEDGLKLVANHIEKMNYHNQLLEGEVRNRKRDTLELVERKLLSGEISIEEMKDLQEQYGLMEHQFYYTATFLLKGVDSQKEVEPLEEKYIFSKCCQAMEQEFTAALAWKPIYYRGALWVCFEEDELEVLDHIVLDYYQKLQLLVNKEAGRDVKAGVSAFHTQIEEFKEAVQESIRAVSRETSEANLEEIGSCNFYTEFVHRGKSVYERSYEKEITVAIIGGNKEQIYDVCDRFFDFLKNEELSRSERTAFIIQFVSSITLSFMEMGLNADEMYRIGTSEIYEKLFELYDMNKVRRFIKWNLIDNAWELLETAESSQVNVVLNSIERYVEEKKGNISLTECADDLGIHPTYIWKVLKKERGKSFSEYQETYKLQEAKRLLLETELPINEIASRLNYTNAQNFIRFFSKETGITPGKYRKLKGELEETL